MKAKNLLIGLGRESIKRVPYMILVWVIISFVQLIGVSRQTAEGVRIAKDNSLDSKILLQKVADLGVDNKALSLQNKQLLEQNVQLANQNAAHIDCLANLFARYTRDLTPIQSIDLSACVLIEQPGSSSGALSQGTGSSQPTSYPNSPGNSEKLSKSFRKSINELLRSQLWTTTGL